MVVQHQSHNAMFCCRFDVVPTEHQLCLPVRLWHWLHWLDLPIQLVKLVRGIAYAYIELG